MRIKKSRRCFAERRPQDEDGEGSEHVVESEGFLLARFEVFCCVAAFLVELFNTNGSYSCHTIPLAFCLPPHERGHVAMMPLTARNAEHALMHCYPVYEYQSLYRPRSSRPMHLRSVSAGTHLLLAVTRLGKYR